jgi:hypothetical protein
MIVPIRRAGKMNIGDEFHSTLLQAAGKLLKCIGFNGHGGYSGNVLRS